MAGDVAQTLWMTDNFSVRESPAQRKDAAFSLLVKLARAGESAAFDQIMIRYQLKVVSLAWRVLGNEEDARDAAQETFLRVYKYLGKYDEEQDFAGWLYRIAINVCRDIARSQRRNPLFTSFENDREAGKLDMLRSEDDTEAAAIHSQKQAIIARALQTLSRKEREAIVLRDLEGMSTLEVARVLGSSQTTVRSQISSARAKIKQYLDRALKRRLRG